MPHSAPNKITPLPNGFVLHSEENQYTIKDVIGQGSYGIVYLAEFFSPDDNYTCEVALKEFAPVNHCTRQHDMSLHVDTYAFYGKFFQEYRALSRIDHYNVVSVFDQMGTNGTYYYSMEYLRGGTLGDYLLQNGQMYESRAVYFIKQIASGLKAFHRNGSMHFDLKLDNLVMRSDDCVVLIDGGNDHLQGNLQVELAHDIYSMACILLCLITGEVIPRPEHKKMIQLLVSATEQGLLSANAGWAILLALESKILDIKDFVNLLEGNDRQPIPLEIVKSGIPGLARGTACNDPHKAKAFLNKMRRMPDCYISTHAVAVELDDRPYDLPSVLQAIIRWSKSVQQGFALGLRLPTPEEYKALTETGEFDSGYFLAFSFREMMFYEIYIDAEYTLGRGIDSYSLTAKPLNDLYASLEEKRYRFYYACDLDPLLPGPNKIHPFAQETQICYDTVLPASIFGFCPVATGGKWGMAGKWDWISCEVPCDYDQITDIRYVALPGGYLYRFLGVIAIAGERIDVYELTPSGHLKLRDSMTVAQWQRRHTFT